MPELLPIPEDSRLALSLLAGLTQEQRAELSVRMAEVAPTTSVAHFAAKLMPIEGLEYPQVFAIMEQLFGMKAALRPGIDVNQFAESVAAGLAAPGTEVISAEDMSDFAEFLSDLLQSQTNLGIAAAAGQLLQFSERVLDSATILTDLRPVFLPGNPTPVAMLPIHLLKITVLNSDQEYTFALDGLDLAQMRKELRRAEAQEAALREFAESAELKWVER